MSKFLDIYTIIDSVASALATYKYTSIREFANITQETDSGTILILLNSDNINLENSYLGKINNEFDFEFFIIKNHPLEYTALQIASIQDECFEIMNKFMFNLNQKNSDLFPVEIFRSKAVRNTTPNAFAGWKFNTKIKTACNL